VRNCKIDSQTGENGLVYGENGLATPASPGSFRPISLSKKLSFYQLFGKADSPKTSTFLYFSLFFSTLFYFMRFHRIISAATIDSSGSGRAGCQPYYKHSAPLEPG